MEKKQAKIIKIFNTNYLRTSYDKDGITEERFQEAELIYNENGKLLKETHFNSKNLLESLAINEYNADGLTTSSSQYNDADELCQKNIFEYDNQKRLIKKGCFYGPESPEYATRYVYENDLLIREDSYDDDEFSFTEKEYSYKDNQQCKVIEFDEDGNTLYATETEYNEKGLISKIIKNEVMQKDRRTYIFEYDDNNRKIKELIYNYDNALIAKAYYSYNENGNASEMEEENLDIYRKTKYSYEGNNCVKIEQFDKKGELLMWSDYEFNDQNEVSSVKNFITDEVDTTVFRIASAIRYETEWFE